MHRAVASSATPHGRARIGRIVALAVSALVCAVAAATGGCSDPARSSRPIEPIPIPQFPPDAAPAVDSSSPDDPGRGACGAGCAAGACDEGVCRRCVFAVDEREHPEGRVVARGYGIPVVCAHMPASSAVTVTASGDVSTEERCTKWRSVLRVISRKHGQVGSLQIDALGEQVYPVHLEGVTASDSDGNVELVLEVGDVSSDAPGRCAALRFHPDFTVAVAAM